MQNVHWEFHGNHEYSISKAMDGEKLADEIMEHHFNEYGKGFIEELIIIDMGVLKYFNNRVTVAEGGICTCIS